MQYNNLREPLDSGCFFKSHYQRAKNRNLNRPLCVNGWITAFEWQFFWRVKKVSCVFGAFRGLLSGSNRL